MLKRDSIIDSIRGIAILVVLIHHIDVQDVNNNTNQLLNGLKGFLYPFITGGWVAVDLFFVLSGFLISGLLFREYKSNGGIVFARFFIRRSFKIYPGFFAFLSISLVTSFVMYRFCGDTRPYFKGYISDGLFLHNYLGGVYVTTWSLDVEEAFYVLLPVFFIIAIRFKKLRQSTLVITYLLLVLIGVVGRIAANTSYPEYSFLKHYSQTHFRLDALFFGVVLSYFYHYNKNILMNNLIRYRRITMPLCILMLLPNFVFTREHNSWLSIVMLAINPIAFGLLMISAIEMKPAFLKSKWLNIVGVNSYAIYLWHPFINLYSMRILAHNVTPIDFVAYILVYLILSVAIGTLATKLIEKPMLNFRDKHFSKKTLPA